MTVTATTAAPSRFTLGKLEQRIANQHNHINRGEKAGKLSSTEATSLRDRLQKAQTSIHNDAFDGNGLSRGKDAAKILQGIGKDIRTGVHDDKVDFGKGVANIDARIAQGLKDGSLTAAEGDALKVKSAALGTELAAATTPAAQKAVGEKLKALSKDVFTERHDGEMDSAKRVEDFKARIAAGIKDGSLTAKEAAGLTARTTAMASNTTSDPAAVNSLSKAIYRQRHNQEVNVPAATADLTRRIGTLAASGKLTPDQVSAFKAQLVELARTDAKAVGPRLNVLNAQLNAVG